jgi:hypothetical protein
MINSRGATIYRSGSIERARLAGYLYGCIHTTSYCEACNSIAYLSYCRALAPPPGP